MTSDPAGPPVQVGVTGASGLLGTLLIPRLVANGDRVTRLVRRRAGPGEIQWADRSGFRLAPRDLIGLDAVIHLAGENIGVRWTAAKKGAILASRTEGTRALARAMADALQDHGPRVLLSASAIGFYGDRGDELLVESSPPGIGFLAEVVQAWEGATTPAEAAGVRVVRLRMGLPLTRAGGVLRRMLLPFRLGVGGRLGDGTHWMSWISPTDLTHGFLEVLHNPRYRGPVNLVAPDPVRNRELTRILGRVIHRPTLLRIPRWALRLVYGEMADQAILASTRVMPEVLLQAGFSFRYPDLEPALRHELG
jgi:uncharacterized protein (TIGR01777 family)